MSGAKWYPLSSLCTPDRQMVAPDAPEAARLRYVGLEHIASGSGNISNAEVDDTVTPQVASVTFKFDPSHVLYGKLRPYLNKVALPDFEGRSSTEIVPLSPTPLVARDYLALLLRSDRVIAAAQRAAVGSRMPRADLDELLRLEVLVPPLAKQIEVIGAVSGKMTLLRETSSSLSAQLSDSVLLHGALLRDQFGSDAPIAMTTRKTSTRGRSWYPLLNLARLESGHTPSRRHPEWWGGHVPWLALPDIRKLHGKWAHETTENINDAGLANSSARLLPVGTVCLCRDASIGFVTVLGRPMATSQHFANWVCDPERLDPEFLLYAFMASHDYLRELGSGSVLKTIYMPTIKSFHICAPGIAEQRRIARTLRDRLTAAEALTKHLRERQAEIQRLPQRLLAAAFEQVA